VAYTLTAENNTLVQDDKAHAVR